MSKLLVWIGVAVVLLGSYAYGVSRYLPISNQLVKADAIIAISGGDTRGRTLHAIDLYQQGWASHLIFSGAAKDPTSPSNARVMQQLAIREGVPSSDISLDESSRDTKENALSTQAEAKGYKTIILVTSEYHQRRAYKEFSHVYGPDITILNSPAPDKNWNRKTWWLTPYGWWISLTEPVKLAL